MKWLFGRVGVMMGSLSFSGDALARLAVDPSFSGASGQYLQSNNGSLMTAQSSKASYDDKKQSSSGRIQWRQSSWSTKKSLRFFGEDQREDHRISSCASRSGGTAAVTLRAVGRASGVSHNAPYKHFANRDALLSATAARDFQKLAATFTAFAQERVQPLTTLKRALQMFSEYGRGYPNRYQLLFSDLEIAKQGRIAKGSYGLLLGICDASLRVPAGWSSACSAYSCTGRVALRFRAWPDRPPGQRPHED